MFFHERILLRHWYRNPKNMLAQCESAARALKTLQQIFVRAVCQQLDMQVKLKHVQSRAGDFWIGAHCLPEFRHHCINLTHRCLACRGDQGGWFKEAAQFVEMVDPACIQWNDYPA